MIQSIKRVFWLLSRRERINGLILLLLLLFNASLEVVGVGVVPAYVGVVAYPEKIQEYPYVGPLLAATFEGATQYQMLLMFSIAVTLFFGFKLIYGMFLAYWKAVYINNRIASLSQQMFGSYMQAPHVFHLSVNMSELVRNINQDCLRVGKSVLQPIVEMLTQILVVCAILVLLVFVSPGIALSAAVFFLVVISIGVRLLQKKVRELGARAKEGRGQVIRTVYEGLMGVKEVRLLGRAEYFLSRFHKSLNKTLAIERFMMVLNQSINPFIEWVSIMGLISAIMVLYLSGEVLENIITIVVLFAVSLIRLKSAIGSIMMRYSNLQHNFISLDTIYEEIQRTRYREDFEQEPVASDSQLRLHFEREIALEDICYRYPGADSDALEGISLKIDKGEAIGIVGATGSGKSTLADVLMGVLVPDKGRVLVDGFDIRRDLRLWQGDIGYIPQHIYLVDGTIRENIALAIEPRYIDENLIVKAANAAQLMEFVERMPLRFDTSVGDRGVKLSGGQRQRVAIARALYHEPDVLVMDEGTSALDSQTERTVIDAVSALKGTRTIIMIAHRLSTLESCDRIIVMQGGRVAAIGARDDLLLSSIEYRRLAGINE